MNTNPKSLLVSAAGWFASLIGQLRSVLTLPKDDLPKREPAATTDPDFEDWLRNDLRTIANPASRYGGDLSGFLATSDVEDPERGGTEE